MKKPTKPTLSIITCSILTFILFIIGCDVSSTDGMLLEEELNPSISVYTESARLIDYQEVIYSSGRLTSKEATKLSFGLDGKIAKIHVNVGQAVKANQVLATLKADELTINLKQTDIAIQQAVLSIQSTELVLAKAKRDYQNTLGLYQDSVATSDQLQNAELQVERLENQLKGAHQTELMYQQKKSAVLVNQEYTTILAPADGIILGKFAKNQETIAGGMPILLFGSQKKAKVIKVNITDKEVVALRIGDKAKVYFDAYPNKVFTGKVQEIAQVADPTFNTFEVLVSLPKSQQKLFDGFIGRVEITVSKSRPMISIPIGALVSANGNQGKIFIVENQKVVGKEIIIFKLAKGQLLVDIGIMENDKVIVSGIGNIEVNESVRDKKR